MAVLACLLAFLACRAATAQRTMTVTGDRLSGFVLPIEPLETSSSLTALRAWAWTVDDTKRLVLDGDVQVNIDGYQFAAETAVVWINRIPSAKGEINQFALYFPTITDPTKRAGLDIQGTDILITASTRGEVKLDTAWLENSEPKKPGLIRQADARLAEHLRNIATQAQTLRDRPEIQPAPQPIEQTFVPVPGGRVTQADIDRPEAARVELPQSESSRWLKDPEGIVRWTADRIDITRGESENLVTVDGSIVIDFVSERASDNITQLTLGAERAVIFTNPGALDELATSQLEASAIRGIYLEGDVSVVAQGGDYVVRTPRAYYDFRRGQAIMLDSWLRLSGRDVKIPVHARADEMRQIASNQWDARNVRVSTSEFHTPHLALGSKRVMIMERPPAVEGGDNQTYLEAEGNTMLVGGVPVAAWPRFSGTVEEVPLRSVAVGSDKNSGPFLQTTWDVFTLLGKQKPEGLEMDARADAYFERGGGGGLAINYDVGQAEGAVDLYGLIVGGDDLTSSGQTVDPEKTFRGVALLEYQSQLSKYWSMQAQLSVISDPTFISSWREDDFENRREYETALYLKHQKDNAAFTVLGKYALQDFISNDYLLASRQYQVDKMPELTYRRYGDSWFNDKVTYSTENRVSYMRMVLQSGTPNSIGVRGQAFGIGNNVSITDALEAQGLRSNWVGRFDSRHELSMPMHWGVFDVTPFVVGRFTAYTDDFQSFSSDADDMRFWGSAGVRVNTQIQRVMNGVESQLFDVHRLRHLIEPYMTLWSAYSSVEAGDLPIYDQSVEPLEDGSAIEVGVRNTWQTQRGGPGSWRSVDYLTFDIALILTSAASPQDSPTPQFFDYRPEYSQFGDQVRASASWLLSDSLTFVGETIYALEESTFARGSVGVELRHSPVFITYIEYRFIEVDDTELLAIDWQYQISPKHRIDFSPQYSFRYDDLQSLNFKYTRSFPDFDLTVQVKYDQIQHETSLGASLGFAEF